MFISDSLSKVWYCGVIMIRQAQKNQNRNLSVLIYDAIKDIAHTLTGENQKENVLSTLAYLLYLWMMQLIYLR